MGPRELRKMWTLGRNVPSRRKLPTVTVFVFWRTSRQQPWTGRITTREPDHLLATWARTKFYVASALSTKLLRCYDTACHTFCVEGEGLIDSRSTRAAYVKLKYQHRQVPIQYLSS